MFVFFHFSFCPYDVTLCCRSFVFNGHCVVQWHNYYYSSITMNVYGYLISIFLFFLSLISPITDDAISGDEEPRSPPRSSTQGLHPRSQQGFEQTQTLFILPCRLNILNITIIPISTSMLMRVHMRMKMMVVMKIIMDNCDDDDVDGAMSRSSMLQSTLRWVCHS